MQQPQVLLQEERNENIWIRQPAAFGTCSERTCQFEMYAQAFVTKFNGPGQCFVVYLTQQS